MFEFSIAGMVAIVCTVGLLIMAPVTAWARFRAARDAREFIARRPDVARMRGRVSVFVGLSVLQLALDLVLSCAFAWIVYAGVAFSSDLFERMIIPLWRWLLAVVVVRVLIEIPIRLIVRRMRAMYAPRY